MPVTAQSSTWTPAVQVSYVTQVWIERERLRAIVA
jgi:hypothetical protein